MFGLSICTHEDLHTDLFKTVEAALKECAGIPVKDFGLVVTLENGEERTFSSTSLAPYRQRFFTGEFYSHFRRAVRKASDDAYSSSGKTFPNANIINITDPTASRIWSG
jgi:hypothetical protein